MRDKPYVQTIEFAVVPHAAVVGMTDLIVANEKISRALARGAHPFQRCEGYADFAALDVGEKTRADADQLRQPLARKPDRVSAQPGALPYRYLDIIRFRLARSARKTCSDTTSLV